MMREGKGNVGGESVEDKERTENDAEKMFDTNRER